MDDIDFESPVILSFTLRRVSEPFGKVEYHADLHCLVFI